MAGRRDGAPHGAASPRRTGHEGGEWGCEGGAGRRHGGSQCAGAALGGCAERRGAAPGSLRAALAAVPARPRLQLRPGAGSGGGGGNFPSSVAMRPG